MRNEDIRRAAAGTGVKLWQVAEAMGMADSSLSRKLRRELPPEEKKITVDVVGHTHIDTAWLWRLRHTREKCARAFSTVNRLMEEYPDICIITDSKFTDAEIVTLQFEAMLEDGLYFDLARQADRLAAMEGPTDEDIRAILPEDLRDML